MSAPSPRVIYERAEGEGRRRLEMSLLEQATTAFIAGVTIVFGIVALGVVTAHVEPELGEGIATVAGALAFGIGVVFLVVGRAELFTENFFDPVATAIEEHSRATWARLARLWAVTLPLNLLGGAVLLAVVTVDGALPAGARAALATVAEEVVGKPWPATLARAVLAGALITLLSYLLEASDTITARILVSLMVGFFLALGPFDHVVVSVLHLLFGIWVGAAVTLPEIAVNLGLSTLGNVAGGLLLITFTHSAQVRGG